MDIHCAVVVELPGQPAIRVARLDTTPGRAFDASYDRLVRQLEERRDRWRESRRHPRKYYASRRLL